LTAELPNVRLNLSNRPENVMLVRQALTGVAEAVELDSSDLNDIHTAVTEACGNVVTHAYEGGEGPLEIEVYTSPSEIEVVVRDHGTGIRPHIGDRAEGSSGIGLLVIQALVHSVVFKGANGPASREGWDGTEVRMAFATPGGHPLEASQDDAQDGGFDQRDGLDTSAGEETELATTTAITIAPTRLARTVLPRLLSALAARAHFSTDRISDAQLIADAVARHIPESISGGHLDLAINVGPRDLELRIAPLRTGRARRLIDDSAVDGLGPVIEKLADGHRVAAVGSCEMLALRMLDGVPPD
jgi:anti-sigma regulatory factor (Ser/Thr protein kinase)